MPTTNSAKKRHRQNTKKRAKNRAAKSMLRTQVRKVTTTVAGGDKDAIESEFRTAVQKLDRAAAKGVIHKNAAARRKSRLAKRVNAASAAQ